MVPAMWIEEHRPEAQADHPVPGRVALRTMQDKAGARRRGQVQVCGFTDLETVDQILRSGEALTATWDGEQVVWK